MRAMSVAVLVNIVLRNGFSPACTAFKLLVLDVDTGIDDVDINTFPTRLNVVVFVEGAK